VTEKRLRVTGEKAQGDGGERLRVMIFLISTHNLDLPNYD